MDFGLVFGRRSSLHRLVMGLLHHFHRPNLGAPAAERSGGDGGKQADPTESGHRFHVENQR